MALDIIGAGFGRTGTHSLKLALEQIGFGPCHHMFEVVRSPEQKALWRAAGKGKLPNWDEAYAGYRSAVDWPTAHFWREISAYYTEAKVILTIRDPEAWHRSVMRTIGRMLDPITNDPLSFGVAVIGNTVFGGRYEDRDYAISIYEAHNALVKNVLPPDRLLTFDVSEGWEPLCAFLGVAVPLEPFPHSNSSADFLASVT